MVAKSVKTEPRPRRRLRLLWIVPLALAGGLAGASWWLTAPLEDRLVPLPEAEADARQAPEPAEETVADGRQVAWPEKPLDGPAAKEVLLNVLLAADARLDRVDCYTATFEKQERLKGRLGPVQTLQMKVRHRPFALYLKFIAPQQGKEVVYAEGHHDNKVIAHSGGLARMLVPRLAVAPDHPLALADSRHAVTEAGIAKLTDRLIGFRRMDIDDDDAKTILDRTTDSQGRTWLRSIHTHTHHDPSRPFARVVVLYDPETFFPVDIMSYDWPKDGHDGELLLAEHYAYKNVTLDPPLTALDFDPANPAYAFHRY